MNVINMLVNFKNDKCHIKREKISFKIKKFLKLSHGNSYHTSLDRQKYELLGDVLNIYVPPLGPEISSLL